MTQAENTLAHMCGRALRPQRSRFKDCVPLAPPPPPAAGVDVLISIARGRELFHVHVHAAVLVCPALLFLSHQLIPVDALQNSSSEG